NRPISASEIVSKRFRWAEQTNAYELAQILREDERFIDLGRFLFGLAAWGNQERQHLGDLVLRILAEAERPMTAAQVFERLQKFRSFSRPPCPTIMRPGRGIRNYGSAHYGFLSGGESFKFTVAADTAWVERVIRRSDPPLSFNRLCDIL